MLSRALELATRISFYVGKLDIYKIMSTTDSGRNLLCSTIGGIAENLADETMAEDEDFDFDSDTLAYFVARDMDENLADICKGDYDPPRLDDLVPPSR